MSVDSPLLTKQRVFAAKVEATTGTAASLTAAEGVYNCFNPKIEAEIPAHERQGQSSLSQLPQIPGGRKSKFSFMTELFGSGTAMTPAPAWADVLLACAGFHGITGNIYKPLTGASSTATLGLYQAGWFYSQAGAMLDLTIKGKTGHPVELDWKAEGVWQAPTAVSLIAPTYPTVIPPRFAATVITIGGNSFRFPELDISLGNKIYVREDANDQSGTGYHAAFITDRKITVKLSPEALPLGTQNWFSGHVGMTSFALSAVIGTVAGNIITITAPAMQLMDAPKIGDRSGTVTNDLVFQCNRSASAGDDELAVTFS